VRRPKSSFSTRTACCPINLDPFPQVWITDWNILVVSDQLGLQYLKYGLLSKSTNFLCTLNWYLHSLIFIMPRGLCKLATCISWTALNGTKCGQLRQSSLYYLGIFVESLWKNFVNIVAAGTRTGHLPSTNQKLCSLPSLENWLWPEWQCKSTGLDRCSVNPYHTAHTTCITWSSAVCSPKFPFSPLSCASQTYRTVDSINPRASPII
jgi:hypothetical protein